MVIRVFIYWVLLPVFCFFSAFCLTPWFFMQKLQPLFCLRGLVWCNLAVLCWLSAAGGCYWVEDGSGICPGLRTGITSTHSSVLCLMSHFAPHFADLLCLIYLHYLISSPVPSSLPVCVLPHLPSHVFLFVVSTERYITSLYESLSPTLFEPIRMHSSVTLVVVCVKLAAYISGFCGCESEKH